MAVNAGATVVATQDWHPASTPHFAKDGGIWPVHCVAETWGAALHPDLRLPDGAAIVRKGANGEDGYSGFTMRDPVSGETIRHATRVPPARGWHPAGRGRRPGDRLLREGDGARRAAPRLRDGRADRRRSRRSTSSRATAARATEAMADAGVTMWRTVMR